MKTLLCEAINLKDDIKDFLAYNPQRQNINLRLNLLLNETIEGNKKLKTLQKRLLKHKEKLLTFLYIEEVPPTNNGSERAIRNVKVKQKISANLSPNRKPMILLQFVQ